MEIHILPDHLTGNPEVMAMVQAFYSRSQESIVTRMARLGDNLESVKKALSRYYIGYGHNSIGDCGTVTVFIEGVSIIAAKALQENPLYNGQECSTRYIELANNLYEGGAALAEDSANDWLGIYNDILPKLRDGVRVAHPIGDGENQAQWENATAARAFDVARGWLPIALLTNLSVSMTLRKFNEFTTQLMAHPLTEVVEIALKLRNTLQERYPSGIRAADDRQDARVTQWVAGQDTDFWYLPDTHPFNPLTVGHSGTISDEAIKLSASRPKYAELPVWIDPDVTVAIQGTIDYGSWRDMQRHRRNIGRPPLPRATVFYAWYLEEAERYLPAAEYQHLKHETEALMTRCFDDRSTQALEDVEGVYGLPLGVTVPFTYHMSLAQAVYFAELRSGVTVHGTLRPVAQLLADWLKQQGMTVFANFDPGVFDIRRGSQTIVERA